MEVILDPLSIERVKGGELEPWYVVLVWEKTYKFIM